MEIILTILIGFALLSILILVHEFGHFFAARKCGVKVEEFGLGLPPKAKRLFRDSKKTEYTLNWLPFGGFVRLYGESSFEKKFLKMKNSFVAQPVWKRIIIVIAGVAMNFLTGCVFLFINFLIGSNALIQSNATDELTEFKANNPGVEIVEQKRLGFPIMEIKTESPAQQIGLKKFDFISAVNDQEFNSLAEFREILAQSANSEIKLTIFRRSKMFEKIVLVDDNEIGLVFGIALPNIIANEPADQAGIKNGDILTKIDQLPVFDFASMKNLFEERKNMTAQLTLIRAGQEIQKQVLINAQGKIGVEVNLILEQKIYDQLNFRLPVSLALVKTPLHALVITQQVFKGVGEIFTSLFRGDGLPDGVGGPVAVAKETFYRSSSFTAILHFAALLSFTLAIFNILPIPALDGGQLFFLIFEALSGYRPNPKIVAYIHSAGYFLLLSLIVFVSWNDLFG
jgi:regulator of sigma E protease